MTNQSSADLPGRIQSSSRRAWPEQGLLRGTSMLLVAVAVLVVMLGVLWSRAPAAFDVRENALSTGVSEQAQLVPGYVTTATLVRLSDTLLDKRGGYLSNDVMPPGIYLDNMPSWETGVLTQVRDATRALRNDFGRSQSQSAENKLLASAQPHFNYDAHSWILPSSESEYRKGTEALRDYLEQLSDHGARDGQFFTRADNLGSYLQEVEKRLGDLAQRLAASVGEDRHDTSLAGDPHARQSTPTGQLVRVRTPRLQVDNVFYEARGYTWGLLHMLQAIRIDFEPVLQDKNAVVSLQQIIRELEHTQERMWSPMVLNGTGFGLAPNHSLVMASYISRANAALIDLHNLLQRG